MLPESVWPILEYFFDHPYEEIHIREISRRLNLTPSYIKKCVDRLMEENLLLEKRYGRMRLVKANVESAFFRYLKLAFTIRKMERSGMLDFLKKNIPAVSSIVLYGSAARGMDSIESDIDILAIGGRKRLNLSEFEEKVNRRIQLIVMSWGEWKKTYRENRAFYTEVITRGVPLFGDLPVIE